MRNESGIVETPWGRLAVEVGVAGLRRVIFDAPDGPPLCGMWATAFADYLAGQPFPDDLPVDLRNLPSFTQRVLAACRAIPFGSVTTYAALAHEVDCHSPRAVGQALGRNPIPLVIPCHRVIGANGRLTGFRGGLEWKRALLAHEGTR